MIQSELLHVYNLILTFCHWDKKVFLITELNEQQSTT